jgi:hypothetical protein
MIADQAEDGNVLPGTPARDLVAGQVIAPEEPWIREYLGLPSGQAARTA